MVLELKQPIEFVNEDGSVELSLVDDIERLDDMEERRVEIQKLFESCCDDVECRCLDMPDAFEVKGSLKGEPFEYVLGVKGVTPPGSNRAKNELRVQPQGPQIRFVYNGGNKGIDNFWLCIYKRQNLTIFCAWESKTTTSDTSNGLYKTCSQTISDAAKYGFTRELRNRKKTAVCAFRAEFLPYFLKNRVSLLHIDGSNDEVEQINEPYDDAKFESEVYLKEGELEKLKSLLKRKKNLILQGSPGTGKTFAAKRLAYCMMGCKDYDRIEMVQFHKSTAYDDFVIGYRPSGDGGFAPTEGTFVKFCRMAAADEAGRDYFFIIDEINRADISKVFGELLMLIEKEHRNEEILLSIDETPFFVPDNLYIIGMMNTADRGLALIDYALRRRFAFYEMEPALEHPLLIEKVEATGDPHMQKLRYAVIDLNEDIKDDDALGSGFRIGHSYFCEDSGEPDPARSIVEYELVPLVEEYWFDDKKKREAGQSKLKGALGSEGDNE